MKYPIIAALVLMMFLPSCTIIQQREAEQRRNEYVKENSDDKYNQRILAGRVWIGADKEHVVASWGNPDDINKTISAYSTREQWIYGPIRQRSYVYFRDGVVTSISQ